MIPCSYWASVCLAVLPSCMTSYVVSVRQVGGLPVVSLFPHPASFRSHLAVGTLAFGCILPTTGRIRDFHPLETCAARRTNKKASQSVLSNRPRSLSLLLSDFSGTTVVRDACLSGNHLCSQECLVRDALVLKKLSSKASKSI